MLKHESILKELCKEKGLNYVGSRGNRSRFNLCIIGEAPGVDEDKVGIPFVGASGREQDHILSAAGIDTNNVYLTNAFKVRPPENRIERIKEHGIDNVVYENQLIEELESFKPRIIVTCGKTSTLMLCPQISPKKKGPSSEDTETSGFGKWRGSLLRSPKLKWDHYIIPIHHPAYVLRNWSERATSVLIYEKAKEELDWVIKSGNTKGLPERTLQASPSYDQARDYLESILSTAEPISADIELMFVPKLKIRLFSMIGFAKSPFDAMAISLFSFEGRQRTELARLINAVLCSNRIIIGQNFTTFDIHWLRTIGIRVAVENVSDTLIRHHALYPELEHTLGFMGMQYTREPFWKDSGKVFPLGRANQDQIRRYCCLDCCVTYEVWLRQEEELNARS